jgi:hypothetical protein
VAGVWTCTLLRSLVPVALVSGLHASQQPCFWPYSGLYASLQPCSSGRCSGPHATSHQGGVRDGSGATARMAAPSAHMTAFTALWLLQAAGAGAVATLDVVDALQGVLAEVRAFPSMSACWQRA